MRPSETEYKPIVGIMADSHGQAACIVKALTFFENQGCKSVYHLGDICDSAHPETADSCVQLLRQHHVLAIKGNNDHQVVVNHVDSASTYISRTTIGFLQQLPLTIEIDHMVLAHSLPFVKQRGLSSMVGALGEYEASLFFRMYPHKILIRGHSHLPELIRSRKKAIVSQEFIPGEIHQLTDLVPAIITCGAVDQGIVMIWDQKEQTLSPYKLK